MIFTNKWNFERSLLLSFSLFFLSSAIFATNLKDQFEQKGYIEIDDEQNKTLSFDSLYQDFDALIDFLQKNPSWTQKLYTAKERFIRSKNKSYSSTDFFGLYDDSKNQISFYYSIHFHQFILQYYPEFKEILECTRFFDKCLNIQTGYQNIFNEAATALGLETIFCSENPPILLKVIKYLPNYAVTRPHYDGTAFSLFLDSTDNDSLVLAPYKPSLTINDFSSVPRKRSSILLIPGAHLTEFAIYPTPHIVIKNGNVRYATIAFAMRPHYKAPKNELTPLPNFK